MEEFARRILLGPRLEDKLAPPAPGELSPGHPLAEPPALPGREGRLARFGKAEFPASLAEATSRGRVLHFFANHELLALELMALALLRFPDAPPPFREGILRTMAEEQSHLALYLKRMRELGVDFGDLPLSRYFWDCLRGMRAPLDFVTRMSLTFEQANLDYSTHFRDACEREGDAATAEILHKVYLDEIGHVKHGVAWFNRWREPGTESDWAAYVRLLEPPMTARRAKGLGFDTRGETGRARIAAGLSEEFVVSLDLHSGSRGRPPALWVFNAQAEREMAGQEGAKMKRMQPLYSDLEHLPIFLAHPSDFVLVGRAPRAEWLRQLHDQGFGIPTFIEALEPERLPRLSALRPWAWSPGTFEMLRPLNHLLVEASAGNRAFCEKLFAADGFSATGLARFYSKSWAADFLARWLASHPECAEIFGGRETAGRSFTDPGDAERAVRAFLAAGQAVAAKAPFGASGSQVKKILAEAELAGPLGGWIRNTIARQGEIVLEPWLDKVSDLSMQLEISSERTRLWGPRRQLTGVQREYRGTRLGPGAFSPDERRLLARALPLWKDLARGLGRELSAAGFEGPAGIDAITYRDSGQLRLKPLVELNPRLTMGRIALALEEKLAPGTRGAWVFLPVPKLPADFVADVEARHPAVLRLGGTRLECGVIWTSDPLTSTRVLTALIAGEAALTELA